MRFLFLLALLAALPAAAQSQAPSWSMAGMLTEMVPVLLDAASDDFIPVRGDLLNTQGTDSLWVSTYQPAGPSGPLFSRTAMNRSVDQSMFWFTIDTPDTAYGERLYGITLGTLNRQVGQVEGADGLGWMLAVAENSPTRKVVQWVECAEVGRIVEAMYQPTDDGADIVVSVVRRGGQDCPPPGQ